LEVDFFLCAFASLREMVYPLKIFS